MKHFKRIVLLFIAVITAAITLSADFNVSALLNIQKVRFKIRATDTDGNTKQQFRVGDTVRIVFSIENFAAYLFAAGWNADGITGIQTTYQTNNLSALTPLADQNGTTVKDLTTATASDYFGSYKGYYGRDLTEQIGSSQLNNSNICHFTNTFINLGSSASPSFNGTIAAYYVVSTNSSAYKKPFTGGDVAYIEYKAAAAATGVKFNFFNTSNRTFQDFIIVKENSSETGVNPEIRVDLSDILFDGSEAVFDILESPFTVLSKAEVTSPTVVRYGTELPDPTITATYLKSAPYTRDFNGLGLNWSEGDIYNAYEAGTYTLKAVLNDDILDTIGAEIDDFNKSESTTFASWTIRVQPNYSDGVAITNNIGSGDDFMTFPAGMLLSGDIVYIKNSEDSVFIPVSVTVDGQSLVPFPSTVLSAEGGDLEYYVTSGGVDSEVYTMPYIPELKIIVGRTSGGSYLGQTSALLARSAPSGYDTYNWSSAPAGLVSIIPAGNTASVTNSALGAVTITAENLAISGASGSLSYTITYAPPKKVTLNKNELFLTDTSEPLTALVYPNDSIAGTAQQSVVWSTSDTNIAAVTDGIISPIAEGVAVITAASAENPSIRDKCIVVVSNFGNATGHTAGVVLKADTDIGMKYVLGRNTEADILGGIPTLDYNRDNKITVYDLRILELIKNNFLSYPKAISKRPQ